mmetsp:Transcript_18756/g.28808  ORF Transcript_18756/g.28808 Transcript_18756/m.28808 type:complete len:102 (+) Transcript_18756:1589-1894(+)
MDKDSMSLLDIINDDAKDTEPSSAAERGFFKGGALEHRSSREQAEERKKSMNNLTLDKTTSNLVPKQSLEMPLVEMRASKTSSQSMRQKRPNMKILLEENV